ncbi:MAG: hypothetical protein ACD_80C00167G0010 [uncultured bacterium (gcode 4)]|uniref:Uncharacterized protein n=1 Tax=uncultured bacterium (gcode 4) TaxID=1234023 RepID=K1XI00_9BACT|nr:MAG: hypothetical protein ACD_80C00167G0010 [uncultured bacterium (gcode 4)]
MRLVPNLPKKSFVAWPNIKLYTGSLQKPLLDILDMKDFDPAHGQIVTDNISETRHITFIRHLESKYNEYKFLIENNPDYQEFMQTEDIQRKNELAPILLKYFFDEISIEYETGLSTKWHQDGERIWKLYAELIQNSPELFPDLIYVSPYVRTRATAHYMLKYIQWLDMDFDKLIDEDKLQDLIVWSFQWKNVAIKIDERIRERDHGSNIAPYFIRNFQEGGNWYRDLLSKIQREKTYYYTAPLWGESQVQTNARAKEFLLRNFEKNEFKNIHVYSHHLLIVWALLSVFGWSFDTFYKLNELWRPANGSFTILSQIPKTKEGKENKFRVSGYNLSLQE